MKLSATNRPSSNPFDRVMSFLLALLTLLFILLFFLFIIYRSFLGWSHRDSSISYPTHPLITIVFETDGGSTIDNITLPKGSPLSLTQSPTKEGHEFIGWYCDEQLTIECDSDYMPNTDSVFRAKWEILFYQVTYINEYAETIIQSYPFGADLTELFSPFREGSTFDGWFIDEERTVPFALTEMPSYSLTLYAGWITDYYELHFNTNGGSSINDLLLPMDATIILPDTPEREGYTFDGWYSDSSLHNPFTASQMPAHTLTAYAKWSINHYTIMYVTNDSTHLDSVSYAYQDTLVINTSLTRIGYQFDGWYLDDSLSLAFSMTAMPSNDVTLYAKWTAIDYVLSFDTNGGTVIDNQTLSYTNPILLITTPSKVGYTFLGWYMDESLTEEFDLDTMPAQNLTIYAKWSINDYTISFDTHGGSLIDAIISTYGSPITAPSIPIREGYTFVGWFSDMTYETPFSFDFMPGDSLIVHAKWEIVTYLITYSSDDEVDQIVEVNFGSTLSLIVPSPRVGYEFVGWYYDDSLIVPADEEQEVYADTHVYAKWTLLSFTITFDTQGGSPLSDLTDLYGAPLSFTIHPTRVGYAFIGWYTDPFYENEFSNLTMPAQNSTLYAKWHVQTYTLAFDTGDGSTIETQTIEFGQVISAPTNPLLTGYDFTGWYSDEDLQIPYVFSSMPSANITLFAGWTPKMVTLYFNTHGGSTVTDITQPYGSSVSLPADPTLVGYTFTGWYIDPLHQEPFTLLTMPADDFYVYAAWQVSHFTVTFDTMIGVQFSSVLYYHETIIYPETMTRTGYVFGGWYTDSTLSTPATITVVPAYNLTLYAKWIAE